jgi:hypothetical protein
MRGWTARRRTSAATNDGANAAVAKAAIPSRSRE